MTSRRDLLVLEHTLLSVDEQRRALADENERLRSALREAVQLIRRDVRPDAAGPFLDRLERLL